MLQSQSDTEIFKVTDPARSSSMTMRQRKPNQTKNIEASSVVQSTPKIAIGRPQPPTLFSTPDRPESLALQHRKSDRIIVIPAWIPKKRDNIRSSLLRYGHDNATFASDHIGRPWSQL